MNPKTLHDYVRFQCGECLGIYDDIDDAYECCRPEVREVVICPTCESPHADEEEAAACCEFDPDAPPPRPSAAELEAAGQLRLPI